jgi:hypothetical protein
MGDSSGQLTPSQKDAYWKSVEGTQVTWSGEVGATTTKYSGMISLKCNHDPKSSLYDVSVVLDGTQLKTLPSIVSGSRATITGTLYQHGASGYTITNGHIN